MSAAAARPAATTPQCAYFDRMPIGDSWRTGRSERRIRDLDLYTGQTLLEIASANAQDLDDAYAAAAGAQPAWAARPPAERAQIMLRAMQIMTEREDEIVSWLVHESGSTRLKARLECSVARAATRSSRTACGGSFHSPAPRRSGARSASACSRAPRGPHGSR